MIDRLSSVCPLLADKIRQLIQLLAGENIQIRVVQGLRPWEVQESLYEQGRTKPGKIVTNAPPGHSWHNFGLAVDVAPFDLEGQPDWNLHHPVWSHIVSVGDTLGLVAGAEWRTFPDWPHFEMTGRFPVSPNDEVRSILATQGLAGVWKEAFKQV